MKVEMTIISKKDWRKSMRQYFNYDRGNGDFFYSDLAIERRRADTDTPGIEYTRIPTSCGIWENVRIYSEDGARSIGRPCGHYDSLHTSRLDLLCDDEIEEAKNEIAKKLCQMLDRADSGSERLLIVGLGNRNLTPDSIGTKSAENVKPTLHIKTFDPKMFSALDCSEIAVITPGVTALSGMESVDIVRGVCKKLGPDAIIAIDAIATQSEERLGSTVQISSTGIFPGSGVGNSRIAMTESALGIPIISIGIPTVIDARVLCGGTYGMGKMLVVPREIDEITTVGASIIGGAINQAFGISPY